MWRGTGLCAIALFIACGQTESSSAPDASGAGGSAGKAEACDDGVDNDKNGATDCADPDCFDVCGCKLNEDCTNGGDDDCDGAIDCADPACSAHHCCSGASPKPEQCSNGSDDDCDGKIDCADSDCAANTCCSNAAPSVEQCTNGLDDDCDGKTDCFDPDCGASACGCTGPADCAIPENPCLGRTCSGGTCGTEPLPEGAKPVASLSGWKYCSSPVCMAGGVASSGGGDAPVPAKTTCRTPMCMDGALQYTEKNGTKCPNGLTCAKACPSCPSTCTGCKDASDCPPGDDCKVPKCVGQACGYAALPKGHLTSANKSGDCLLHVCGWAGESLAVADDTDLPDDGNPCTFDFCTSGKPTHTNAPTGTPCGAGGKVCDGKGACAP